MSTPCVNTTHQWAHHVRTPCTNEYTMWVHNSPMSAPCEYTIHQWVHHMSIPSTNECTMWVYKMSVPCGYTVWVHNLLYQASMNTPCECTMWVHHVNTPYGCTVWVHHIRTPYTQEHTIWRQYVSASYEYCIHLSTPSECIACLHCVRLQCVMFECIQWVPHVSAPGECPYECPMWVYGTFECTHYVRALWVHQVSVVCQAFSSRSACTGQWVGASHRWVRPWFPRAAGLILRIHIYTSLLF